MDSTCMEDELLLAITRLTHERLLDPPTCSRISSTDPSILLHVCNRFIDNVSDVLRDGLLDTQQMGVALEYLRVLLKSTPPDSADADAAPTAGPSMATLLLCVLEDFHEDDALCRAAMSLCAELSGTHQWFVEAMVHSCISPPPPHASTPRPVPIDVCCTIVAENARAFVRVVERCLVRREAVHRVVHGVLRVVNQLDPRALVLLCSNGLHRVLLPLVEKHATASTRDVLAWTLNALVGPLATLGTHCDLLCAAAYRMIMMDVSEEANSARVKRSIHDGGVRALMASLVALFPHLVPAACPSHDAIRMHMQSLMALANIPINSLWMTQDGWDRYQRTSTSEVITRIALATLSCEATKSSQSTRGNESRDAPSTDESRDAPRHSQTHALRAALAHQTRLREILAQNLRAQRSANDSETCAALRSVIIRQSEELKVLRKTLQQSQAALQAHIASERSGSDRLHSHMSVLEKENAVLSAENARLQTEHQNMESELDSAIRSAKRHSIMASQLSSVVPVVQRSLLRQRDFFREMDRLNDELMAWEQHQLSIVKDQNEMRNELASTCVRNDKLRDALADAAAKERALKRTIRSKEAELASTSSSPLDSSREDDERDGKRLLEYQQRVHRVKLQAVQDKFDLARGVIDGIYTSLFRNRLDEEDQSPAGEDPLPFTHLIRKALEDHTNGDPG